MKAAQLVGPGRIEPVEAPMPVPKDGEVLVQSHRASICGSDIHIVYDGFYLGEFPAPPGFPGHEGVGQVVTSLDGSLKEGTWVLAVPSPPVARTYADFHVVVGSSLIALPDGGDPDRLLNAQQLGTVVYAFRRHWPSTMSAEGKTVAICGAGSAGLFFVQLARRAGFEKVIIADRSDLRLGIAKEFGAESRSRFHPSRSWRRSSRRPMASAQISSSRRSVSTRRGSNASRPFATRAVSATSAFRSVRARTPPGRFARRGKRRRRSRW